jgi:argininosuccinate lyase
MPGFTHTRKAMPSSIGLWAGSFVEGLIDDLGVLKAAYDLSNQSPLGSAAGFGVSLSIDRTFTAKALSFPKVQKNTLYAQNSRGKFESVILDALSQIMLDTNRLASDLILFSEESLGFFIFPKKFCTGSSLMPNKKNPDVLEIARANYKVLLSYSFCIKNLLADLPSGYNRDYQLTKEPFIRGLEITQNTIDIMNLIISQLKVDKATCEKAITTQMFATDETLKLVEKGVPFRVAYRKISSDIKKIKPQHIQQNIRSKKHIGAPGNLQLAKLKMQINKAIKKFN